jgi:hypothetical protein
MVAVQTHRRAELAAEILATFGFTPGATLSGVAFGGRFADARGEVIETFDPTTGHRLAQVGTPNASDYDAAERAAQSAFDRWRRVPAPRRGEIVRRLGEIFRERAAAGWGCAIALACGDSICWNHPSSPGGGRQAGSGAWNDYMRRQTCTVNYGASLPLAPGVRFDFDGSA